MNARIWDRLHNDRSMRDHEIEKLNRLKLDIEKVQSDTLSQRTSVRLRTSREPDSAILDRARMRHIDRMAASMLS